MFELNQLKQLLAIAECGTISRAAEKLGFSQPAMSRSMQRLEEELKVPLFIRQKNRLVLNDNGRLALEYARRILDLSGEMERSLWTQEKNRHTISIGSCAPAPIWKLTPDIARLFPDMMIQSETVSTDKLLEGLTERKYQIIVTTEKSDDPRIISREYCKEEVFISLPETHPLAKKSSVSLSDFDGQSFLLYSKIGIWYEVCRKKMPNSLLLIQEDLMALNEVERIKTLPTFVSNLAFKGAKAGRKLMPVDDPELHVTFYLEYYTEDQTRFSHIPTMIDESESAIESMKKAAS